MTEHKEKKNIKIKKGNTACQFIVKLTEMMKSYPENVLWSEDGTQICFRDLQFIINQVMPKYFRHRNMLSFVRQLNMYYFSKIQSNDSHQMRFRNNIFHKGNEHNFHQITRRNKARDQMINTFQKGYAKTLQLIENQISMPMKMKQLIRTGMEYYIIMLKNLKKIKVSAQELIQQTKSARGKDIKNSHFKVKEQQLPQLVRLIQDGKQLDNFIKQQLWRDIHCSTPHHEILQASFESQVILLEEPRTIRQVEMNRVFNLQSQYSIMNFHSDCSIDKNLKEENFDKNEEISLEEDLKGENCKQF